MQEIGNWAFGAQSAETQDSLMIARNLARLYADVLEEPLPPDLARLIGRLEERLRRRAPARANVAPADPGGRRARRQAATRKPSRTWLANLSPRTRALRCASGAMGSGIQWVTPSASP